MSHPLKKYARGLQDVAAESGEAPGYMRCLTLVERHIAQARATVGAELPSAERREAIIVAIYDLAKGELSR